MAATICPTITVSNPHDYRNQLDKISGFARRVHIDVSDGRFAPVQLVPLEQIWWPARLRADIHLMYQFPFEYIEVLLGLGPQLIIVHAEADGDFEAFAKLAHQHGIETGVALLKPTPVSLIESSLDLIDHVLVFSGDLGHYGGKADLKLLEKVQRLKQLKPQLEVAWDGGINDQNARTLSDGGVDVLNVGGYIARDPHPQSAYATLERELRR